MSDTTLAETIGRLRGLLTTTPLPYYASYNIGETAQVWDVLPALLDSVEKAATALAESTQIINAALAELRKVRGGHHNDIGKASATINALRAELAALQANAPRYVIETDGVITPLMPSVKLPQRYEYGDVQRESASVVWMRANDVLAMLAAAWIAHE